MAIKIPSKNIYEINNKKIIDNEIGFIDYDEHTFIEKDNTDMYNFSITSLNEIAKTGMSGNDGNFNFVKGLMTKDLIPYTTTIKKIDIYYVVAKTTFNSSLVPSTTYQEYTRNNISVTAGSFYQLLTVPPFPQGLGFTVLQNNDRGQIYIKYENTTSNITESTILYKIETLSMAIKATGTLSQPESKKKSISKNFKGNIYSIPNNELTQNTCTRMALPIGEYISQHILIKYENGKETAKLLCGINNYYSYSDTTEDVGVAVTMTKKNGGLDGKDAIFTLSINAPLAYDLYLRISYEFGIFSSHTTTIVIIESGENSVTFNTGKDLVTNEVIRQKYKYATKVTSVIDINDPAKDFIFKLGDEVEPYIKTPSGEEPMSKNKVGQAKIFLVTGVKIINDGAVFQELTLQEK